MEPTINYVLTFCIGVAVGLFTKDLTNRWQEARRAKADLLVAIDRELATMRSKQRADGTSNHAAITALTEAAGRFQATISGQQRQRFSQTWTRIKDQVQWDDAYKAPEHGFDSFGYRNFLIVADHLRDLRKFVDIG